MHFFDEMKVMLTPFKDLPKLFKGEVQVFFFTFSIIRIITIIYNVYSIIITNAEVLRT